MTDYGRDLSAGMGLTPAMPEVEGDQLMREAILRRLITPKGGLYSAPFAVSIDLRSYMSADLTADGREIQLMKAAAYGAVNDDPRVLSASVTARYDQSARRVSMAIRGQGTSGPFALTLSVTALSVELLSEQGSAA